MACYVPLVGVLYLFPRDRIVEDNAFFVTKIFFFFPILSSSLFFLKFLFI